MGFEIKNGVLEEYIEEPGVTEIVIPDSVTEIGKNAFAFCKKITSVTIPDSVIKIGQDAFYYCTKLTSLTIPGSVTEIGWNAFSSCLRLTAVHLPDGMTEIVPFMFSDCMTLTSVTIPDSVTSIGSDAFSGCTELRTVHIPDSVTEIGEWAFLDCERLAAVTLPDGVEKIGLLAFPDGLPVRWNGITLKNDPECNMTMTEMISMVRNRNFSVKMRGAVKYPILWQMFCANPEDAELFDFIKKRFSGMFRCAIEQGNTDAVEAVCKQGKLLTSRNIDKLLEYAIAQKQTEIQLLLMNYKNEHIGYSEHLFKL